MLRYFFLIFGSCLVISMSGQNITDPKFEELYNTALECLSSKDSDCHTEFLNCTDYLTQIKVDTLATSYFLMLGDARMRNGRWDDLALNLFKQAHERSEKSAVPCYIVKSQFALTKFNRFKGVTSSALDLAQGALKAANACGEKDKIARANVFLGSAYLNQSSYNEALTYFHEAERIYASIGDEVGMAGLMLDMSSLYGEMHEKSKARAFNLKAAQIFKKAGEEMKYAIALIDLSASYNEIKMPDSALYYLPIAEKIVTGKHQRAQAYMEQNYGSAYLIKNEYSRAIAHYEKGIELIREVGDLGLLVLLNNFISESYNKLNQPEEAYEYALISDSISKQLPKNFKRSQALLFLARSAYKSKKYDQSYDAFLNYIMLRDSLLGAEKRAETAALEEAYEAEKRDSQIAFQAKENALLEAKNDAANNRNYALLACLILLGALTYGLIARKNNRIKTQVTTMKLKELENESLNAELSQKRRELTTKALQIARNNEVLQDLQQNLKSMSKLNSSRDFSNLIGKLKLNKHQDNNWKAFTQQFNDLNPGFHRELINKYPELTAGEMRIAALLRMNLSTKDIAGILSITEQGAKKARYRLRKKMKLEADELLEKEIMRL